MKLHLGLLAFPFSIGCSPASPGGPITPIIVESPPDAAAPSESAQRPAVVLAPVATEPEREAWPIEKALAGWTKTTQCPNAFDYSPRGGLQTFWCHRPASLSIAVVREAAGGKIFASGPHGQDDLVLDSANDFGRYDPAFVKWLVDALPAKSNDAAQAAYERFARPLARIFWKVLQKTKSDKACFDKEKAAYADLVTKKKLPQGYYERWFYFMNPAFCSHPPKGNDSWLMNNGFDGGVDGNVTKTVTGFWVRRSIDGTADGFAQALEKMLRFYYSGALSAKADPPKKRPDVGY